MSNCRKMHFRLFCEYLDRIESVSSRNQITALLAELFTECKEDESAIVCYLLSSRVAPLFVPVEFNVAEKTILAALSAYAHSHGRSYDTAELLREAGDSGDVAEMLVNNTSDSSETVQRGTQLSLHTLYDRLWEIASLTGKGSSDHRVRLIADVVGNCSPIEAKYVTRILSQKLRLGLGGKTLLDSLSVSVKGDKGDRDELGRAFGVSPDSGYIAKVYKEKGLEGLCSIQITPGVPVLPMLVEREKDAESIMKRIPNAIVQPKFDGLRCQIHVGAGTDVSMDDRIWWSKWKGKGTSSELSLFEATKEDDSIRIFSRNLEDMTEMFPEIVSAAKQQGLESAILDGEIIGYNENTNEFLPFQETMTRKRKYGVNRRVQELPVKAFIFDVLSVNGESLVHIKNKERVSLLERIVVKKGLLDVASSVVVDSAKELLKVFHDNVTEGLEGVVVKDVNSIYEPGVRGLTWLKLKRAFQGNLADTIDVVILGYYRGRGKQARFGIGALLGGLYDKDLDVYVSITKIGTGITEDQWIAIKKDLDEFVVEEPGETVLVSKKLHPDVWVEPRIVATVEADEITKSPIHTAGAGKEGVGFALRFPRLKVWKRDKLPDDATSVQEIRKMHETTGAKNKGGKR